VPLSSPLGPTHPATESKETLASPAEIERPRSALHSGDFREGHDARQNPPLSPVDILPLHQITARQGFASSPVIPWHDPFAATSTTRSPSVAKFFSPITSRGRAPSLGSFSSSYILKAPTSPLVHQANNPDLESSSNSSTSTREIATQPSGQDKSSRRRTLPPGTFGNLPAPSSPHFSGVASTKEQQNSSFLYQVPQPRRSITLAYSLQVAPSSHFPVRPRRPSWAADSSPPVHAPMVGSFEESILRGRMSTTPSKPLDFTAQIGVLGRGKCKASLRCPPHVTVPFPAVFYSYPTSGNGRSIADDSPSPYVGMIDLENSLAPQSSIVDGDDQSRMISHNRSVSDSHFQDLRDSFSSDHYMFSMKDPDHRSGSRKNSRALRAPPGGSYRIPQVGQLQIVIKTPNKTAVKLFLVPYDLSDMEPGTKTFLRQRSYSAGPVIDMPLTARKNLGTDRPEASLNSTEDPRDKPVLRYLIHVNICCPVRGRFYLHSTIRVVFANRVPDGKEKLRNEIQYPEPRYSPYKPFKDTSGGGHSGSTSFISNSTLDRTFIRRDSSFGSPTESQNLAGHVSPFSRMYQPSTPPSTPLLNRTNRVPVSHVDGKPFNQCQEPLVVEGIRASPFDQGIWKTTHSESTQRSSSCSAALQTSNYESLLAQRFRALHGHDHAQFDGDQEMEIERTHHAAAFH
jgi:hypothetical protein